MNWSVRLMGVWLVLGWMASHAAAADAPLGWGWYDRASDPASITSLVGERGGQVLLPYHVEVSDEQMRAYLDEAHVRTARVILEVPRRSVRYERPDDVEAFVAAFEDHPAVMGWYTADEPHLQKWSVETMELAYAAVRRRSQKPVFIVFSYSEINGGQAERYAGAYDVLMVDAYPYRLGSAVLGHGGWARWVPKVKSIAERLEKPWWNVLQAMGQVPDRLEDTGWSFRLPTYAEVQFQLYWSIVHDAQGVLYWAWYRAAQTVASPGEAFDGDGPAWLETIHRPAALQFERIRPTLAPAHEVRTFRVDQDGLHARLYRDPESGSGVLILVNGAGESRSVALTLPGRVIAYERVDSGDGASIPWRGRALRGILPAGEVQVYVVTLVWEPGKAVQAAAMGQ